MDGYFRRGLRRVYNYHRILDKLKKISAEAEGLCPVCLEDNCNHKTTIKINGKNARELLRWWLGVIAMECKDVPFLLTHDECEYLYPKLILSPVSTDVVLPIPENAAIGCLFENNFYPITGGIITIGQTAIPPAYGYLWGSKFVPFKRFENGYFFDVTPPTLPIDTITTLLKVPQGVLREFAVEWL